MVQYLFFFYFHGILFSMGPIKCWGVSANLDHLNLAVKNLNKSVITVPHIDFF